MSDFDLQTYKVGQVVCSPGPDGVRFGMTDSGAILLISMADPTPAEISAFSSGISIKVSVANGIIFILSRLGKGPWMDSPYNRYLSPPVHLEKPAEGMGYALHAMLVNARTGVLIKQKLIGMDHTTSMCLYKAISLQQPIPNYQEVLRRTFAKYTTSDLLKLAWPGKG